MIPTTLSVRTLDQLSEFLDGHDRLRDVRMTPFFSMVDRRKRMHLDLLEQLPDRYPATLASVIPYSSEVERMGVFRMPLPAYCSGSEITLAYERLWEEVKAAL
jgi:cellulose biosynthesis protein BcsQ